MDPLGDPHTTRPIQTGWEFTIELYPSGQFGFIDDPDRQFGNGLVLTRTRTRSDSLEPLLTLAWEHLEEFVSAGEINQSVWEVWVWLADRFTFC